MTSESSMTGRVALVTGGGSGIGRAACLRFAVAGASVAIVDRHLDAAEETLRMIGSTPSRCVAVVADIAVESDTQRMVDIATNELGGLDFAFNNAGITGAEVESRGKRAGEINRDAWEKIIAVNLTGTWMCMRAELGVMLPAGHGSIVNNASIAGLVGWPGSSAYAASKHGVVGMTKTAAVEYASNGIRINALCPGYVTTPMMHAANAGNRETILAGLPMSRFADPDEIARVAVWLSSDAASYVTGMTFAADGGFTAA